jgi:hypothetical protein
MTIAHASTFGVTLAEDPARWDKKIEHLRGNAPIVDPRRMEAARAQLDRQLQEARDHIEMMLRNPLAFKVIEEIVNTTLPEAS